MLRSLAPPQLRPMTDNHKMMCGCAICYTSKYMQEYLIVWWREKLKSMKDKAENSRRRKKVELTQSYQSYSDYAFPEKQTRHPRCENVADSVLCTPTNDEYKWTNCKFVLWKCTVCSSIDPPGVEMD